MRQVEYTNPDHGYTIVLKYEDVSCPERESIPVVHFVIYEEDPNCENVQQEFAEGYIKWDGCMQIEFSGHFCQWSTVFGDVFKDIYLQAALIMGEDNLTDYGGLGELKKHYKL